MVQVGFMLIQIVFIASKANDSLKMKLRLKVGTDKKISTEDYPKKLSIHFSNQFDFSRTLNFPITIICLSS